MIEFLQNLFRSDFLPHGHCYFWQPGVVWLHVLSDLSIALAYYCIPFALWYFIAKRPDLQFNWIFAGFAAFIFACGTTHLMNIWTLWYATYRFEGVIKLLTGALSVGTAIMLVRLLPTLISLPTPRQLAEANHALEGQIAVRQDAERRLEQMNRELEQRVEQRTAALRRSNEDLAQFAFVASHDLQEPLRMVSSYTQLLRKRYHGRLDADADLYIDFASNGAARMQGLIRDLLAFSSLGNDGQSLSPVDLQSALAEALKNLAMSIQESGAVVTFDPLPTIEGDLAQLTQLFQNLIGNSLKYAKPGLTPLIHVGVAREPRAWTFSVRDNGRGFEPGYAELIFGVFKRLSGPEIPGTGIGLSIARKIIERHGGRIWCDSRPDEGATFFFSLPRHGQLSA